MWFKIAPNLYIQSSTVNTVKQIKIYIFYSLQLEHFKANTEKNPIWYKVFMVNITLLAQLICILHHFLIPWTQHAVWAHSHQIGPGKNFHQSDCPDCTSLQKPVWTSPDDVCGSWGYQYCTWLIENPCHRPKYKCLRFWDKLLINVQLSIGLLEQQECITMQSGPLWRSGSDELEYGVALRHIRTGNIDHQPVGNFTKLGISAGRCIRIRHGERVKGVRFGCPFDQRLVLDLSWGQLVAEMGLDIAVGIEHLVM